MVHVDTEGHVADFVRLNEQWIEAHFALEDSDRRLAADPWQVVRDGGHILSIVDDGRVLGVCALFRDSGERYQLARMAVDRGERGRGLGEALMRAALEQARRRGARTVYLMSNTVLVPAIALYRKHGFHTVREGPHPVYARCNIVMERTL
jgi:ribosomal protein S18 acetylase RimI-like enzyme